MNDLIQLNTTVLGYDITACAKKTGGDWSITITGGCASHVGSVSLAEYHDGTIVVRSIVRDGHKDQVVGERFAQRIAQEGRCNVCVCCGIHYDAPTEDDLLTIVAAAEELLDELCDAIQLKNV